jgi:hypothetical protein
VGAVGAGRGPAARGGPVTRRFRSVTPCGTAGVTLAHPGPGSEPPGPEPGEDPARGPEARQESRGWPSAAGPSLPAAARPGEPPAIPGITSGATVPGFTQSRAETRPSDRLAVTAAPG